MRTASKEILVQHASCKHSSNSCTEYLDMRLVMSADDSDLAFAVDQKKRSRQLIFVVKHPNGSPA